MESSYQRVNKMRERKKKQQLRTVSLFFLPLSVFFIETMSRIYMFGLGLTAGWFYIPILSLIFGFLALFIVCLFPEKHRFKVALIYLFAVAAYHSFHLIYYDFFQMMFTFDTLNMAGGLLDWLLNILLAILKNFYKILTAFIPFIALLIFRKKNFRLPKRFTMLHGFTAILCVVLTVFFSITAMIPRTPRRNLLYIHNVNILETTRTYGIGLATLDDLWQTVFGELEEDIDNPYDDPDNPENPDGPENPKEYGYNTLNIDFETLAANAPNKTVKDMHEYFATVPASRQNEYTGYFEGKNLIFISVEGFCHKAISKDLTPTLYKMYTEGFYFKNFYDSLWGGSTATGEYANMTGNFYNSATCLEKSSHTLTYSALGNVFKTAGYKTYAYHNHTYTYYHRDVSHPNFGYDYKGVGKGLTLPKIVWPNSDLEMAQVTASEYINQYKTDGIPFHTYYMTVSGHANYTFMGNSMASRHKDVVANLPYTDNVKAYIASEYEVELMLNNLIEQLSAAGILDDTVFAMCCDHYPYGLEDADLANLYSSSASTVRGELDTYRNAFILWSSSMEEPVVVDTPCSSYDMVPTLYNLFGIPYESKIITGTDILSDKENLVIINTLDSNGGNWNWVTSYGTYYSPSKKFVPTEACPYTGAELDNYVSKNNKIVQTMNKYSKAILDNNYYSYVFNNDFSPKAVKQ